MKSELQIAIENKDERLLIKALNFTNSFKSESFYLIENVLNETWHSQHEDIINTIYLENLQDDRFINPIIQIALNRNVFRPFDDELESTLRKCVHALKTINSKKANEALKLLLEMNNDNVKYALENYK
ncbi:hypothetical protein OBK29_15030 [Empedobacter falsenii]|uniref:hypothetical protein n=1 Tax=Empedobacter falsenii TaxID=343874 RepID=UPI003A80B5F3